MNYYLGILYGPVPTGGVENYFSKNNNGGYEKTACRF